MPLMMFPEGLNREREMSAMISALTHVICGEEKHDDGAAAAVDAFPVTPNNNPSGSATPSSKSSSYGGSSALKRRREEDCGSFGNFSRGSSSPAIPASMHQGQYF